MIPIGCLSLNRDNSQGTFDSLYSSARDLNDHTMRNRDQQNAS